MAPAPRARGPAPPPRARGPAPPPSSPPIADLDEASPPPARRPPPRARRRAADMGGVLVTGTRLPWWRRRRVAQALPPPPAPHGRFRWAYDTRGPKVRIGVLWFVLAVGAARLGGLALAALYGIVGMVAALQSAYAWRRSRPPRPHRLVAGLTAAGLAAASPAGVTAVAVALLAAVLLALALPGPGARHPTLSAHAGRGGGIPALATLRCGLPLGVAAAAPALVHGAGPELALALVLLVSAYEAGDYLVGSGAANLLEGPLAGAIGVLVVSFPISLVEPQPLAAEGVWALGALTALCCPLGQLAASAILPRGNVFAPALRRIDSLLVTGPVWVAFLLLDGRLG